MQAACTHRCLQPAIKAAGASCAAAAAAATTAATAATAAAGLLLPRCLDQQRACYASGIVWAMLAGRSCGYRGVARARAAGAQGALWGRHRRAIPNVDVHRKSD